ncbi:hypothetical protein [Amycolatopsis taiwanensis]|uniref:Uncharacterized protein n=1 Tax=Amycolatopsis taiwanensis TaxID=342230 RepID=A0A9W6R5J7_9PSEU|nr:hypothetical protein [Amycolatopsis taiwanensis]GLY68745.1 hypothetical protein Atai01_53640 [Amycolatopsis taiwanensis]
MTQHTPPDGATPVRAAMFSDGPDFLLLNPDIPARRWRGARVRAGLRPRIVFIGLAGAGMAVLAALFGKGFPALLALSAGTLVVGVSALAGWGSAASVLSDHRHCAVRGCRVERRRGDFVFRSRDFADLGAAADMVVRALIVGVEELHRSPARAWIDPAQLRQVHVVVWEALCCLDRTRAARILADELAADPDTEVGGLAAATRRAVTAVDDGVDEVARHVHGCLVLARAWEAKLRHADLAARTEHTLDALPGHDDLRRLSEAAEALPRNLFASITAARDITGAGAFPWEQSSSSGQSCLIPHDRDRGGTTSPGTVQFRRTEQSAS